MNLIEIFYSFRDERTFIWTEDQGSIKFSFNLDKNISSEVRNILKEKKLYIWNILNYNQIYSEEDAKSISYYKIPASLSQNVLSNTQKAIYMHSKFDKVACAYNVPLFIKFQNINIVILKKALKHLLAQHKILRMSTKNGSTYDILDTEDFEIAEEQIYENQVIEICKEKSKVKFELDGGKLINIEIIRVIDSDIIILNLTHHHILSDAYSLNVLVLELLSLYQSLKDGIVPSNIRELDYFDFVSYQETILKTDSYKQFILGLRQKLSSSKPLILKQKRSSSSNEESTFFFRIDSTNYKKLSTLALKHSVSLYSILLTSYYHILYTYSQSVNFPIGITISNRPQEFAKSIGPFISILPLITEYNPRDFLLSNIIKVHEEVIKLNENSSINLNLLTEKLNYHPEYFTQLIHLIFTMHNFGDNITDLSNKSYELLDIQESSEKLGISINVIEKVDHLLFNISYEKDLYDRDYIESIMDTFSNFLVKIDEQKLLQPLGKIKLLSNDDSEDVINCSKKIYNTYPSSLRIDQLYEQQVLDSPDSIAVIDGRYNITYDKLNKKSNKLAYYLANYYQVGYEDPIIFCLDRSENMMTVMLAILKIGATCVPIDTECPDKRIAYILNDTKSKLLITSQKYYQKLNNLTNNSNIEYKILFIEDLIKTKEVLVAPEINLNNKFNSSNLAYIIYTSGTTGEPKGVMVEHKSTVNYTFNVQNYISSLKKQNVGFATNIAFDLSITTTLSSLCSGAKVIIYEGVLQDLESYKQNLIKYNIEIIKITPSYLDLLIDFLYETKIRKIIVGGEKLLDLTKSKFYDMINSSNIHIELYDEYGPTETSVGACINQIYENDEYNTGKPYDGYQLYILSEYQELLPTGAVGELYIGGVGLARGYIEKPSITAEKFIANPFITKADLKNNSNLRLYKTGDICRWLSNGNLEYIGRNDFQVKIDGYRVELAEIEKVLSNHHDIAQSIVLTDYKKIIAYIVPGDFMPSILEIQEFIQQYLPHYMVPELIFVDALPLNSNGKIDRNALLAIRKKDKEKYLAPRSDLEKNICEVWGEILSIPLTQLSLNNDFFKLGGNSILAIKLINKLNKTYGYSLSISAILENTKLEDFCNYLNSSSFYINTENKGQYYEF